MDTFECIATKLDVREFSLQNISAEIKSKIEEKEKSWEMESMLSISKELMHSISSPQC